MALDLIDRRWLEGGNGDPVLNTLHLLREFRHVEAGARESLRTALRVNAHDLQALRFIVDESESCDVTPRMVAAHLGITSASTSGLVERLVVAGYVTRDVDEFDRRGRILRATEVACARLDARLCHQVAALLAAAGAFSAAELATVAAYLEALIEGLIAAKDEPASVEGE